jgi:hypothetical protein
VSTDRGWIYEENRGGRGRLTHVHFVHMSVDRDICAPGAWLLLGSASEPRIAMRQLVQDTGCRSMARTAIQASSSVMLDGPFRALLNAAACWSPRGI